METNTELAKTLAEWNDFKVKFGRDYNETDHNERFKIFSETLKTINEHNKKYEQGEVSYTLGINQFADKTPEELKKSCCGKRRI